MLTYIFSYMCIYVHVIHTPRFLPPKQNALVYTGENRGWGGRITEGGNVEVSLVVRFPTKAI